MKTTLLVLISLASVSSFAADKKFLVNGKDVTAGQATLASLKGDIEVYKCTQVEAKASKSGSITLKNRE